MYYALKKYIVFLREVTQANPGDHSYVPYLYYSLQLMALIHLSIKSFI